MQNTVQLRRISLQSVFFPFTVLCQQTTTLICERWARSHQMLWKPRKCAALWPDGWPERNTIPALTISSSTLRIDTQLKYLGIIMDRYGITSQQHLENAKTALQTVARLCAAGHLTAKTPPKALRWIISTYIRSLYSYSITALPLSLPLLSADHRVLSRIFKAVLRIRTPRRTSGHHILPTTQLDRLCAVYRIPSLRMYKADNIASMTFRGSSLTDHPTRGVYYRHLIRHINETPTMADLRTAREQPNDRLSRDIRLVEQWKAVQFNSRGIHIQMGNTEPLALQVGTEGSQEGSLIRIMAVRWHLGRFPLHLPGAPAISHAERDTLKFLSATTWTTTDKQAVEQTISNIIHRRTT